MARSTVESGVLKTSFAQGELVKNEGETLIVFVTGSGEEENLFSGVIVGSPIANLGRQAGVYRTDWIKEGFGLFTGSVTLTEGE